MADIEKELLYLREFCWRWRDSIYSCIKSSGTAGISTIWGSALFPLEQQNPCDSVFRSWAPHLSQVFQYNYGYLRIRWWRYLRICRGIHTWNFSGWLRSVEMESDSDSFCSQVLGISSFVLLDLRLFRYKADLILSFAFFCFPNAYMLDWDIPRPLFNFGIRFLEQKTVELDEFDDRYDNETVRAVCLMIRIAKIDNRWLKVDRMWVCEYSSWRPWITLRGIYIEFVT